MDSKFLEKIRERFKRYQTYYQVLGIQKENIKDEDVKNAYYKMNKALEMMFKNISEKEVIELKEEIQEVLDNAYTALKTEHSRKNYQELLEKIKDMEESER